MAIIKNIKGRLVDVEALVPCTVSYFRDKLHIELKEKEHIQMATGTAYFMAKQNLLPEFSPFDYCSLRKIYGNDFFDDKPDEMPDFDGCVLLIYHTDTDWDISRIGRCPLIAQDPILFAKKMLGDKWSNTVGKYSNIFTKAVSG